ncbi:DEAD/DEAH box helicase domain-containing protein [Besnoitia besnoiti]|uniref:ATP-dependent RNA helicase n=1 Tax=Besnoitia besnoiti TaxID=94643 RepID=A0A2A9M960_BESBE|nr:DEAD/DEAH box helicase domain-containing protein [Besnoitia besnoiti]PFH32851.1 DEAD/DEAH box helicase domain-containing protein [Besnoitia besnoiti]
MGAQRERDRRKATASSRGGGKKMKKSKGRRDEKSSVSSLKLRQREQQEIRELEDRICVEMPLPGLTWQPPLLQSSLASAEAASAASCAAAASESSSAAPSREAAKGDDAPPQEAADSPPSAAGAGATPTLSRFFFSDLPLSQYTRRGLRDAGLRLLSSIQARAIPHALRGADVLGEAKTGSGKTLCFVIPVLECLYRHCVSNIDGLAALVLAPTRELAVQIFDVFKLVGRHHEFSAGCLIGGKSVSAEAQCVNVLNIIVGTPGRVLQHMDESHLWEASNLKILVIDEADRLVDMGFLETTRLILSQLPSSRQSLLFSATLKSAVKRLAALAALPDAERISVDAGLTATPLTLRQSYVVVPAQHKLSALFSFLRTHSAKKILVFVSSCKQTRFLYEIFRILKPGPGLLYLHGRQKQQKRLEVFQSFVDRPGACCLISTDLASRGIDFTQLSFASTKSRRTPGPAAKGKGAARQEGNAEGDVNAMRKNAKKNGVDFVVQLDCPDSIETYIHRVGRTARMQRKGQALLMVLPSEVKFVERLHEKKIEMKQLFMNPKKAVRIENKLQSILAENTALKFLAQQALASYLRCIALMPDKSVFNLPTEAKPLTALANGYGLSLPPSVTVLAAEEGKARHKVSDTERGGECEAGDPVCTGGAVAVTEMKKKKNLSKLDRLKEKIRQKKADKEARRLAASAETETVQCSLDGGAHAGTPGTPECGKPLRREKCADARVTSACERGHSVLDDEGEEDGEESERLDDVGFLRLKMGSGEKEEAVFDKNENGRLLHEQLIRKPGFQRERLRFRKDGTAKVKGLAVASMQQSHVFFQEDEDEEEATEERAKETEADSRGEEGENDSGLPSAAGRAAFLQKMRLKVLEAQQGDKERNRKRIQERHTRQRQKERARRQAEAAERSGLGAEAMLDLRNAQRADEEDEEERETGEGGSQVSPSSSAVSSEAEEREKREVSATSTRRKPEFGGERQQKGGAKRRRLDGHFSKGGEDAQEATDEADLEARALRVLEGNRS